MSIIDDILNFFDDNEEIEKYTAEFLRWNIELTEGDDLKELSDILCEFDLESYCVAPEIGAWIEWRLPVYFNFEPLLLELNRKRFIINEEYIKR